MDKPTQNTSGNTISDNDRATMHNAGVDVGVSINPKLQTDDQTEDTVVDIDDQEAQVADFDLSQTGLEFVKEEEPIAPAALPLQPSVAESGDQLEQEFQSQVVGAPTAVSSDSSMFDTKTSSLVMLLTKIKSKLGFKKKEVKEEIAELKRIKEDISEDIAQIKELEESEEKIQHELEKIETIKEEVKNIEEEVQEELAN